jgi:signal transduction histidine kinase
MKKYFLLSILGILGFGVVMFIYSHSESRLLQLHKDVLILFLTAKQIDISTDRDLLQARSFLSQTYDPLVDSVQKLEQTCADLRDSKYGLYKLDAGQIDNYVDSYCDSAANKIKDIETFKSKQAVFRNSLYFLSKLEGDLLSQNTIADGIRADLVTQKLIKASLDYALLPTEQAKQNLEILIERSKSNRTLSKNDDFRAVCAHAAKVFQIKNELDLLTKKVSNSPAGVFLESLRHAYFEKYDAAEVLATIYRRMLFGTCVLFLVFVIYNTVSLLRSAQKLAVLNAELEVRAQKMDQLNGSLEVAVDLANKASDAKSLFLANMSHELRTPMHGILSFARFGQTKIEMASKEKLKSYFDEIHDSGLRLMQLLNALLDLAKLEAGKMTLAPTESSLFDVILLVHQELQAFAEENGRQLETFNHTSEALGTFDKEKIAQVIRNLVSNAIKFSDKGSTVRISLQNMNDALVCDVSNRGIGIPENELTTVFDKFVQSSRTNSGAGGTGLGLAICKQIIEQHNGTIWAECIGGVETKFIFKLPCSGTAALQKSA